MAICKSRNRESGNGRRRMREMGDGNAGNRGRNAGNLRENAKNGAGNAGNLAENAGNVGKG